jgi:acyl-[acyl carrier protein]--UDP-N-acetylglucosamine O-acyltransferase
MAPTNTVGGGVDQTAILGHAPEHRGWTPGDPSYDVQLGEGARIEAFVTVDAGYKRPTRIGARCWLMKHVRVGHDAVAAPPRRWSRPVGPSTRGRAARGAARTPRQA